MKGQNYQVIQQESRYESQRHKRKLWHRIEDYWYLDQHQMFEMQASQPSSYKLSKKKVLILRISMFVILTLSLWVWRPLSGFDILSDYKYLTQWGLYLTWITCGIACFQTPYAKVQYEELRVSLGQDPSIKYKPLRTWKFFIFLYPMVFTMEVIITIVFWTALWETFKEKPEFANSSLAKSRLIMEHTLPMACLLFDYVFINALPFVLRHCFLYVPIMYLYILVNLVAAISTGENVYPILNWDAWWGILVGISAPLGFVLIFCIIRWFNQRKLRRLGYSEFADVIDGV